MRLKSGILAWIQTKSLAIGTRDDALLSEICTEIRTELLTMNLDDEEDVDRVLFRYWRHLRTLHEGFKENSLLSWRSMTPKGKCVLTCTNLIKYYIKQYKKKIGVPNWDAEPAWADAPGDGVKKPI